MRSHFIRGQTLVTQAEVQRSFEAYWPADGNGYIRPLRISELTEQSTLTARHYGLFDGDGALCAQSTTRRALIQLAETQQLAIHALH